MSKAINDSRCLIFMHVAKAGGTTLHNIIEKQYPKDLIYTVEHTDTQYQKVSKLQNHPRKDELRLIKGHMPIGLHEHLNQPYDYITFLRHPVERIISHYFYAKSLPHHYLYDSIVNNNMTIDEYVSSGLTPELENHQTRIFSGLTKYSKNNFEKVTEEHLQLAISVLDKNFVMVGLTEYFDESLLLLKKYFNWNNIFYMKMKVNNSNKNEVSEEQLSIVKEFQKYDLLLYDFFLKKFKILLEKQDQSYFVALEEFRRYNRIYAKSMYLPLKFADFMKNSLLTIKNYKH